MLAETQIHIMAAGKIPSLREVKDLASHLYVREYVAIQKTKFPSNSDQLRAYQYAQEAQDGVNKLLEMEENADPFPTPQQRRAAEEVWKYVRSSIWNSFNGMRNMKLRADYVSKIKANAKNYTEKIKEANGNEVELMRITKQAVDERNLVLELTRAKLAKTSQFFSEMLKREGLTYDRLLNKYSVRRYEKAFTELKDAEQMLVLADIVEASGRSNSMINLISKIQGSIGWATFIVMVGVIVWDVASSRDMTTTALKDTWEALGSAGAGFAGDYAASAAINAGLVAAGVTDTVAAGVAFVGGIFASIVLAAAAAPVMEDIFDFIAGAVTLHIPPELMRTTVTVLKTPLGSPLDKELTTPLSAGWNSKL